MRKTFCDRCKEEIPTGITAALEFVSEAVTTITAKMTGKPTFQVYTDEKPADLCQECKKSFEAWMKAGNKTETIPEPETNRNTKIVVAAIEDPINQNPEVIKF